MARMPRQARRTRIQRLCGLKGTPDASSAFPEASAQ
jgi:hypothetical protein